MTIFFVLKINPKIDIGKKKAYELKIKSCTPLRVKTDKNVCQIVYTRLRIEVKIEKSLKDILI